MKYELIELHVIDAITNKNVALIKRGTKYPEYAVVRNLDLNKPMDSDEQWDRTLDYYNPIISNRSNIECLQKAIECYRVKTEDNYISRARLEEIATKFKDTCFEIGEIEEIGDGTVGESLILSCDLEDYEIEFFGIPKEEYETTKAVMEEFM